MDQHIYGKSYEGDAAQNYQRYFVPTIGAPVADDLMAVANLQPGERVLDVACGTGVVAKLAAAEVGAAGRVVGLDVNPGMLAVARATTEGADIEWCEASAEAMPLPDDAFDAVLCHMGLQFVPDRGQALREARRVLAEGGRLLLGLPGPMPAMFAALADALARHVDPRCARFVEVVFSLHDPDALRDAVTQAGFEDVTVDRTGKRLRLPEPETFLWQYVHGTPLRDVVARATDAQRTALARDVRESWGAWMLDGALTLDVGTTTVHAR